ncbi:MAG: hypothetical protein ACHP65_07420 [Legionellales bacterium]
MSNKWHDKLKAKLNLNKHLEAVSAVDQMQLLEKYRGEIDLKKKDPDGEDLNFNSEAFNKHVQSRTTDSAVFSNTKGLDGTTPVSDKLNADSEDAKAVRDAIALALQVDEPFKKAQQDYTGAIAQFKDMILKVPTEYTAEDLIETCDVLVHDALKAITEQQKSEKDRLDTLFFKNNDFAEKLRKTLNIGPGVDTEQLKKNMMEDFDKSQTKQLEDFNKSTNESLDILRKAVSFELMRIQTLAMLAKNDSGMLDQINKLSAEANPASTAQKLKAGDVAVAGVSLKALKKIKTITGGEITQETDGSFSLKLTSRLISPLYYGSPKENVLSDFTMMAQLVKATGSPVIKFKLNFADADVAAERARTAYEACINAGFAPDKIIIEVNGVTYRNDKKNTKEKEKDENSIERGLFKEHAGEYDVITRRSEDIIARLDEGLKLKSDPAKVQAMKKEFEQLRDNPKPIDADPTPVQPTMKKEFEQLRNNPEPIIDTAPTPVKPIM